MFKRTFGSWDGKFESTSRVIVLLEPLDSSSSSINTSAYLWWVGRRCDVITNCNTSTTSLSQRRLERWRHTMFHCPLLTTTSSCQCQRSAGHDLKFKAPPQPVFYPNRNLKNCSMYQRHRVLVLFLIGFFLFYCSLEIALKLSLRS